MTLLSLPNIYLCRSNTIENDGKKTDMWNSEIEIFRWLPRIHPKTRSEETADLVFDVSVRLEQFPRAVVNVLEPVGAEVDAAVPSRDDHEDVPRINDLQNTRIVIFWHQRQPQCCV